MKVRFRKDGDYWVADDANKALVWQQGVMVIGFSKTSVGLGTCREPVGEIEIDEKVQDWLDEHVEYAPVPDTQAKTDE